MVINDPYIILAGNIDNLRDNTVVLWARGLHINKIQEEQHRKGFRQAVLVQGQHGYYVRSPIDLENNIVLLQPWQTAEQSIEWGRWWVKQDSNYRVFYAHKKDLVGVDPRFLPKNYKTL